MYILGFGIQCFIRYCEYVEIESHNSIIQFIIQALKQ